MPGVRLRQLQKHHVRFPVKKVWDDEGAAADSEVEEINSAAENDEDDGASTASSEDDGEGG